ncbi:unnamed protein product [Rotaria sp. Silwood2]|nr:unnamed protein product [Rotaria sp. Silwood2]CAF2924102.1 unnamed protein product [Rotaria sp. Silwood2]CAF3414424.1 unnamed protein product [Rotaria sp. Silwood2]
MGGRNTYEFIRLNLPGALPSITSIENDLAKDGRKIIEGEFRYDALNNDRTSNDYQLAVCSEDCTGVIQKVVYNASTNTFIGFATPLDHGIPVPRYFQTDSYEQLKTWFENNDRSSLLNVHMLQLLTTSESSSSPFLLGAYGITSKFDAIDVLRRWLWIFERSQLSNIRVIAFASDCDAKYLRAMRLITGFFAKLPNILVSERSDALEVKLPKEWSSWFFMRTRQLFFCMQDPVHLCTKVRNRMLSESASMLIGEGQVSVDVLFDLIKSQSKLMHGLVKTDVQPKDRQNFSSCMKITSDSVLSALENISGSYATQVFLQLLRSIIIAYFESSTSTMDRIYHSWKAVFISRLWWSWLQLADVKKFPMTYQNKDKSCLFITKSAYYSIEINAHTLLSIVLLVCQGDLPESALSLSDFHSQSCENMFRLTRSMSGMFSSNVNFTVDQCLGRAGKLSVLQEIEKQSECDESGCSLKFPKHHKRRYKKSVLMTDRSQASSSILTHSTIEKTIFRAFNDAYNMLSVLGIDVTLKKTQKNTLSKGSTFVRTQIERKSHTTDYSDAGNYSSDDETDSILDKVLDISTTDTESSSENDSDELLTNSNSKRSQFQGIRIFNEIPSSQIDSYFQIKIDGNEKYMHKQTACWLFTDSKEKLSADRLQRVKQAGKKCSKNK